MLFPRAPPPTLYSAPCERAYECKVPVGGTYKGNYLFGVRDVGYGTTLEDNPWGFEMRSLPQGITYTHTPIQSVRDGYLLVVPYSEITYRVSSEVTPGLYTFTMRVFNGHDSSKYVDVPQALAVEQRASASPTGAALRTTHGHSHGRRTYAD